MAAMEFKFRIPGASAAKPGANARLSFYYIGFFAKSQIKDIGNSISYMNGLLKCK